MKWDNAKLFERVLRVNRSKNESGRRAIPLNDDAMAALARLRERAEALGCAEPEHYVFPACEHGHIDPTRHQKTWRTAWRNLTRAAGLKGFRFHDLRHQAIAGHLSREMLEHYSHVRMKAKREALDKLSSGLMREGLKR